MPRPDGSINSGDWDWSEGLPTLGVEGGAGYNPSRDMPFDRGMQALGGGINSVLSAIFPRGMAGQGNPNFWNTQAGVGVGTIPFSAQPKPNVILPDVRLMPQPNVYLPNVSLTPPFNSYSANTTEGNRFDPNMATTYGANPNYSQKYGGSVQPRIGGTGAGGGMGGTGAGGGMGGTGAGGGMGVPSWKSGMTPDEMKYANKAEYWAKLLGQDPAQFWNTTKIVYMNKERNGNTDPDAAMGRQIDDILWGNAARAAGILTGNADADAIVWRDHYTAGGTFLPNGSINPADPMAGHNYAADALQAAQDALKQAASPDAYPTWLTP